MDGTNRSLDIDSAHSTLHTTEVDDCATDKLGFSTIPGTDIPKVLTKYFVRQGKVFSIGGWDKSQFTNYWMSQSIYQKKIISVMAWFDLHKPKHLALINGLFSFVAIAIVTLTSVILSIHHPHHHSYLILLCIPFIMVLMLMLVYLSYNQYMLRKFDQWFRTNGSEPAKRDTHNEAPDIDKLDAVVDIHDDTDNHLNLGPDDSGTEGDLRQFKGHDTLGDKVQKTAAKIVASNLKRNPDNKASDTIHLLKDDELNAVDIHDDTDNHLNLGPDDGGSGTEGDLRQFKGHDTLSDKVQKTAVNIEDVFKVNNHNEADTTALLKDDGLDIYTDFFNRTGPDFYKTVFDVDNISLDSSTDGSIVIH